jgi:hypothetical protein
MTNPEIHAVLFSKPPDEIPALCKLVQGLMVYQYWVGAR